MLRRWTVTGNSATGCRGAENRSADVNTMMSRMRILIRCVLVRRHALSLCRTQTACVAYASRQRKRILTEPYSTWQLGDTLNLLMTQGMFYTYVQTRDRCKQVHSAKAQSRTVRP